MEFEQAMSDKYPSIEFSSIDELCTLITLKTAEWDTCWYRGCTSPNHELLPNLFRDSFEKVREGYLAIEFRRRAHSRLKGVTLQFDWLCAMQHYGLPTRLLDWTESLGVALYFSIGNVDWRDARPTIWLLDPFALSRLTEQDSNIPIATDPKVTANADLAFRDDWEISESAVSRLPLPVAPNFLFDRIAAQNGTFTIHGTDERPIDHLLAELKPEALLKFVANSDHVLTIVNSIRLLRPSPDAIFPDIEGMKNHLI
jgi:FRG domain